MHTEEITESKGFKPSMLAEVKTLGDKIDLKPMVRQSLAALARIHKALRLACESVAAAEDLVLESAIALFEGTVKRGSVGLAAAKLDAQGHLVESHNIFLGNVQRRRHLERRSTALTNLPDHFISGDID
jgi:hypothetical protein